MKVFIVDKDKAEEFFNKVKFDKENNKEKLKKILERAKKLKRNRINRIL